jgi:hypothetical protein
MHSFGYPRNLILQFVSSEVFYNIRLLPLYGCIIALNLPEQREFAYNIWRQKRYMDSIKLYYIYSLPKIEIGSDHRVANQITAFQIVYTDMILHELKIITRIMLIYY